MNTPRSHDVNDQFGTHKIILYQDPAIGSQDIGGLPLSSIMAELTIGSALISARPQRL
jgi:hypothetical protein